MNLGAHGFRFFFATGGSQTIGENESSFSIADASGTGFGTISFGAGSSTFFLFGKSLSKRVSPRDSGSFFSEEDLA